MAANLSDDAKILEEMGYKQELFRGFSGLMSFAFCFTAVSVVPSISLGFFSAVGAGGPAEMVWAWVVGSVFCIIAGISMAEITSVYPSAGSVYHWAGQLGPAEWSPVSSYVCGWFNMFGNIAGDAAFSSGFATCVGYCVVMRDPDTTWTVGQQVGTSVGILFVWLVMDLARIDIQGFVNNFAIVFQMAASVIIVVALLATSSELASAKLVFTAVYDCTSPAIVDGNCTTDSVSGYTVVLGITSVLFAFTGYEAGAHMCEETTNARTSAPWGIVFTVLCCAALGLFYILGFLFATADVRQLEDPLPDTYTGAAGVTGGLGLMALLTIMFFFAGASSTTVTSRIVFALARDGGIPGYSWLYHVSSKTHAPIRCCFFVAFTAGLLMLLPLGSSTALSAITGSATVGYQLSYAIPIILRCTSRSTWVPGVWNIGRWSLPCAIVAALWQVLSSLVFFWPVVYPVTKDNMNWTVVVVFGTMSVAALYWFVSARYRFVGPKRVNTVETTVEPIPEHASHTKVEL